eukprot:98055_1
MVPFTRLMLIILLTHYSATNAQTPSTTSISNNKMNINNTESSESNGETYAALGILVFLILLFTIICADIIHKRFQKNQKALMPPEYDIENTLIGQNPPVINTSNKQQQKKIENKLNIS